MPAGVGWATLRAVVKLWLGFPARHSGVWSAGNGPAMRAAVLGLYARDDRQLVDLVAASTRLTHTDPRAEAGAVAVAVAARYGAAVGSAGVTSDGYAAAVDPFLPAGELRSLLCRTRLVITRGGSMTECAAAVGVGPVGVSGYVNQTVPIAVAAWLSHPGDVRAAVEAVVLLGGDTDTTAALAGALVGATAGPAAIPAEWLDGIVEWPRSVAWVRRLAGRLEAGGRPLPLFWPALVVRNGFFAIVVIVHALRRLLPPWRSGTLEPVGLVGGVWCRSGEACRGTSTSASSSASCCGTSRRRRA